MGSCSSRIVFGVLSVANTVWARHLVERFGPFWEYLADSISNFGVVEKFSKITIRFFVCSGFNHTQCDSNQKNPPDELSPNDPKKIPFGRIIPPFSSKVQNVTHVFKKLHDSNSNFRTAGISSAVIRARTTPTKQPTHTQQKHSNITATTQRRRRERRDEIKRDEER